MTRHLRAARSGLCCAIVLATASCKAGPVDRMADKPAADVQTQVEALKQKTLKELKPVKGGTFTMGDFGPIDPRVKMPYSGDGNDDVLREVMLSDYAITAHKITYADYDIYTAATGQPKIAQNRPDLKYRNLPNMPAGVDWYGAQEYCQWIGKQVGRKMGLPTEAQWEYAARNRGQMIVWPTDDGSIEDGRNVASFEQVQRFRADHRYIAGPTPIGQYPSNPLGLHDLIDHGFEWVRDWYAPKYDPKDTSDPLGPKTGTEKVQRSHSDPGGDALALVSMTFTRFSNSPSPPPDEMPGYEEGEYKYNQNAFNAFRCVAEGK